MKLLGFILILTGTCFAFDSFVTGVPLPGIAIYAVLGSVGILFVSL